MNEKREKSKQIVDQMFQAALKGGASDIHIVVGKPPLVRKDGEILPLEGWKEISDTVAREIIFSILSDVEKERFNTEKELDIGYQIPNGERFRINLHWEREHPSMAARAIPRKVPDMDSLNLQTVIRNFTNLPHGLVLIVGPTGSGKSTTLASLINAINTKTSKNIITLEDPIEFLFEADKSIIRQRQLGRDFISFEEGLKHILRQDPDVVMVGEMRDMETISTTLTIAETGHLVFATLHTYSAAQTIDRLIDAFPAHQQNQIRTQLALTLRGVVMQQLLPKIDGGRIAAREVMVNNMATANLIRENKVAQIKNVLQTSSQEGMFTLGQNLKELIANGSITEETAQKYLITADKNGDDEEGEKKKPKKKGWL